MFLRRLIKQIAIIIRAMRPKQWAKNIVIFAALVFDRQLGFNNLLPMLRTFLGFIIFCLLSGVVYLINDEEKLKSGTLEVNVGNIGVKQVKEILSGKTYTFGQKNGTVSIPVKVGNKDVMVLLIE